MKKWFIIAAMTLAVSGCSSAPEGVNTFLLPAGKTLTVSHANNQPLLIVRPVEVAAHLAGNGLVYQTGPTNIVQAQHHLWAESLGVQLTQQITQQLRLKQRRYWSSDLASQLTMGKGSRLLVKFSQFNGSYTGNAELRGEWVWLSSAGKVLSVHPFDYQIPLQKDGYPALVNALAQGVERLTTQIAANIG
jgi:hypothetical protein